MSRNRFSVDELSGVCYIDLKTVRAILDAIDAHPDRDDEQAAENVDFDLRRQAAGCVKRRKRAYETFGGGGDCCGGSRFRAPDRSRGILRGGRTENRRTTGAFRHTAKESGLFS